MRVLLLATLLFSLSAAASQACIRAENEAALKTEMLKEINAARSAQGVPPLRANTKLDKAAAGHACDNAARRSISHDSSNGDTLKERLKDVNYRLRTAAENTGRGFATPDRAVTWWMNSPKHRDNMLNKAFTEVGIGLAISDAPDSKNHWILNFGKPR